MSREHDARQGGGFDEVDIPRSAFAGDDGTTPGEVADALQSWQQDPGRFPEVLAALQSSRLLVPVVAVAGTVESGHDGLAREKDSDMATVLLQGADGRLALLAFTGTAALTAWDPGARPVPVGAGDAARAAVAEGAAAVVVDIAGPVSVTIEGEDLQGFAQEWTLARVGERSAWVR